jgi:hypothetical protein
MKWFRWYRGTVEDSKFALIADMANKDGPAGEGNRCYGAVTVTDAIAVWAVMLEDACKKDHWGVVKISAKHIAIILRWWPDEAQSVIDAMVSVGLIDPIDGGLKVRNWEQRQYVSDTDPTNKERQKRYREKSKAGGGVTVTDAKRPRNGRVTRTETDTDTETDTERTKKKRVAAPTDGFEEFYEAFPRRIGKGQALKAYRMAMHKTDASTLLNGAKGYAKARQGEDKQFTKHPATWLNGMCWLDEPDKAPEGPKADPEKIYRAKAAMVAKGLPTNHTPTGEELARMVSSGLVTPDQARKYGFAGAETGAGAPGTDGLVSPAQNLTQRAVAPIKTNLRRMA